MLNAIETAPTPLRAHRACHSAELNQIYLLHSTDDTGRAAWYFIKVKPHRMPLFKHALMASHLFDLEAFGEIVESGYGDSVPVQVTEAMKLRYGWCGE